MKKKILALCLVVALMATAIAGATLAYFTDKTDVATNTFTVGDVDIKLDEAPVDPETGKEKDGDRVITNKYENVYPGQTVDKDPTVTFEADSRDCYVRMIVTLDAEEIAALQTAFPANEYPTYWAGDLFLLENLTNGTWDNTVWVPNVENTKVGYYEFWYKEMIPAETAVEDYSLPALFTEIKFPEGMTNDQIGALNNFDVKVVAHAMQADGFADQAAAWAAWTE